MTSTASPSASTSAFAPLRSRAFFWLWLGVTISGTGTWMQAVGAQWLFINDPNAATVVALVQTASMLPMMFLALPSGVLADSFDRRWLLFFVQVYVIGVASLLAFLAFRGAVSAVVMLGFTFALGVGMALQLPTWQSLIPDVVPREQIGAATRLDMISVNVARAVGPALGGFIIGAFGVPMVFAANACSVMALAAILLLWKRPRDESAGPRERFIPALRAGGRFVLNEPVVKRILLRLALFILPAGAMWALLPIIASQRLHLEAAQYGILFGALGAGAVSGAMIIPKVKGRLSPNAMLAVAALALGVGLATTVLLPNFWLALVALVVCGLGWTATASILVAELQVFLPQWVRARTVAIYLMTFTACQAIAAPVWGQIAQHFGVVLAIVVASALVAFNAVAGLFLRMPDSEALDRSPNAYWNEAPLMIDADPHGGPVAVSVEFVVPPENESAFLEAMQAMRRSRRRSGAIRWELYRVGEQPDHFVEIFTVASWDEHQRQHDVRLTAEDEQIENAAFQWATGRPTGRHLLPP